MKIFLVGLPGSGKSTLGKELAEELKISFVDLDVEIEKAAGKDIKTIFRENGEAHFRKLESENLQKWCSTPEDFVMATGGGAPCFFDNIKIINKAGRSIFLDVPIAEIIRRMNKTERAERPLLGRINAEELKNQLESLHRNRLAFYNQTNLKFTGPALKAKDLQKKLISYDD